MKVEFKRNIMKNPGKYVWQLANGLYESDDYGEVRYILVGADHKQKYAIRLDTLFVYQSTDWLGAVIPIGKGNQIILTGEGTEQHVSET